MKTQTEKQETKKKQYGSLSFVSGKYPNISVEDVLTHEELPEAILAHYASDTPKCVYRCFCKKCEQEFFILPRTLASLATRFSTRPKMSSFSYEDVINNGFVLSASAYIGQKFNHLTIMRFRNPEITGDSFITPDEEVVCECDCEKHGVKVTTIRQLVGGSPKSCGCEYRRAAKRRKGVNASGVQTKYFEDTQSFQSRERLYGVWASIKARCYNPNRKEYASYGGRGITMCKSWRESYEAFRKWALANGYDPNAPKGECTIDRIDNNRGYKPSNCRWVNTAEQNVNKVNTVLYSYYGRRLNAHDWSKRLNIDYQELLTMLHRGMSIGQIIKKHKLQNTDFKE